MKWRDISREQDTVGYQTHSQDLEAWNKLKGNIHNCGKEEGVTSSRKYPKVVMNLDFIKDANLLGKNRCWE